MRRLLMVAVLLLSACATTDNAPTTSQNLLNAQSFFNLYAKRQDINALMQLYALDAELLDMGFGDHVKGRDAIKGFLRWGDGTVELMQDDALVVLKQVEQGNSVVTHGYFTRFKYHGSELGPWYFVIWLEFDKRGRIIRQTDWINYTPKDQFIGGENLNLLIDALD